MCSWIWWDAAWLRWNMLKDSGWKLFARTVAARAYPRLIMNVREKWWMVWDIVLPLIGLCAYVFIYRANNAPADVIGFVIIGGAMSAYWMNVLRSEERRVGKECRSRWAPYQ